MKEELTSVGLPPDAGNIELAFAPSAGVLVLSCMAPSNGDPRLLVGRVYFRGPEASRYSLLGSNDPDESWSSPLPWRGGVLVECSRVSVSAGGESTAGSLVGIKYAEVGGGPTTTVWSPPDGGVWICKLMAPGPRPDEVYCRVGRLVPSPNSLARYSIAVLNLTDGTLSDVAYLTTPFW